MAPIVLLHGFPQTVVEWSRLTPHLHERGYRTIARTQRGCSSRARPLRLPLGLNRPPSTARC
ncbi:alpha/beta fold hydrolase [Nocardia tengchongensis]|uniref:alpha/beta fold hydrolase n=1 Tax=Nocardia tengchongensis TaxID=2055889 RepID=UPI0036A1C70A